MNFLILTLLFTALPILATVTTTKTSPSIPIPDQINIFCHWMPGMPSGECRTRVLYPTIDMSVDATTPVISLTSYSTSTSTSTSEIEMETCAGNSDVFIWETCGMKEDKTEEKSHGTANPISPVSMETPKKTSGILDTKNQIIDNKKEYKNSKRSFTSCALECNFIPQTLQFGSKKEDMFSNITAFCANHGVGCVSAISNGVEVCVVEGVDADDLNANAGFRKYCRLENCGCNLQEVSEGGGSIQLGPATES